MCPARPHIVRMRISPDIAIGNGVRVKTPGEQMTGSDVGTHTHRAGCSMTGRRTNGCWATLCAD